VRACRRRSCDGRRLHRLHRGRSEQSTDNPVFSVGIPAVGEVVVSLPRDELRRCQHRDDGSATQASGQREIVASPTTVRGRIRGVCTPRASIRDWRQEFHRVWPIFQAVVAGGEAFAGMRPPSTGSSDGAAHARSSRNVRVRCRQLVASARPARLGDHVANAGYIVVPRREGKGSRARCEHSLASRSRRFTAMVNYVVATNAVRCAVAVAASRLSAACRERSGTRRWVPWTS
jgi:hypothetical protein